MHSLNQQRSVRGIESDVGCKFTELPRINVEAGAADMYSEMVKGGDRHGSYGGAGRSRSGDFGGGRSSGSGNSGSRFGERVSSSVRTGGSSRPGSRGSGGGYSGLSSGRSSKFGGSRDARGSKREGGFRNFSSGRSSRFGDSRSDRGDRSGHFDLFGDGEEGVSERNFSKSIPRRRAPWDFSISR